MRLCSQAISEIIPHLFQAEKKKDWHPSVQTSCHHLHLKFPWEAFTCLLNWSTVLWRKSLSVLFSFFTCNLQWVKFGLRLKIFFLYMKIHQIFSRWIQAQTETEQRPIQTNSNLHFPTETFSSHGKLGKFHKGGWIGKNLNFALPVVLEMFWLVHKHNQLNVVNF